VVLFPGSSFPCSSLPCDAILSSVMLVAIHRRNGDPKLQTWRELRANSHRRRRGAFFSKAEGSNAVFVATTSNARQTDWVAFATLVTQDR
jgi:hypothetical protein